MPRSKAFDERRTLVVAMKLFWAKGYSATSMQDLEDATGLNRTSLYNAFGNKNNLFKKALSLYMEDVGGRFRRIVERAPSSRQAVRDFLEAVIDLHFSKASPGGCLAVLSVMESSQHDDETRAMTEAMFRAERQMLQERLEQGKAGGEFRPGFDAAGAATAIAAAASGLVVLAKAGFTATTLGASVQAALRLLGD